MADLRLSALLVFALAVQSGWAVLCPYGGWIRYGNSCYLFYNVNNTRSWTDSRTRCMQQDGDLVTVDSTAERNWILGQTNRLISYSHHMHHQWWTGLNARPNGNTWKWNTNSTRVNIAIFNGKWVTGHANKDRTHQCGLVQDGKFTMASCNTKYQSICERTSGKPLTCDPGWVKDGDMCYRYFNSPTNYNGARNMCHRYGARLPQVFDAATEKILWDQARTRQRDIWLSLKTYQQGHAHSYVWKWDNGTTLTHPTFWYHNPPGSLGSSNSLCVVQLQGERSSRSWQIIPCTSSRPFVCQKPEGTCPNGWLQWTNRCFFIYTHDAKPFNQAKAYCSSIGATLAALDSVDITQFLYPYVHNARAQGAFTLWIGLTDNNNPGWQWVSGKAFRGWTNWRNNHPTNTPNKQDCVSIDSNDRNLKWNPSATCTTPHRFICQLPSNKALRTPTTPAGHGGHTVPTTTARPWSINCGPQWEDDPNSYSCYFFSPQRKNWNDARAACQAMHGDLISISSFAEQSYINGRVLNINSNFFWVGANDRQTEQGWRWSNGSPFSFIYWSPGEPNNRGDSDCVGISKADGRWSDFRCTDRYGFICEKPGKATPRPTPRVTTPRVPAGKVWGCQHGWRGFNGQCYLFYRRDHIQQTASATICGQLQAKLVSIHSDAENKFVFSLFPRGLGRPAWIGLTDSKREGSFTWSDNTDVTYTHWNTREPNNAHNEDCVVILKRGGWADYACTSGSTGGFICKKPMSMQNPADDLIHQGCPSGLGFRAQCYAYITGQNKGWTAAQADCRRRRGNLATITDVYTQAFVSSELVYRHDTGYWIGLKNDASNSKNYVWATNYTVDYTSWAQSHTGNEHGTCVAMKPGRPVGLWANFNCGQSLPYICEFPRKGVTTPPPTPPSTTSRMPCPRSWKPFRNICIQAFNLDQSDRLSWTESRDYCRSLGGDLLSVWNSVMESTIKSRVLNNAAGTWWIGLNDRDSEEGHVWSDGHGVMYTNWSPNEPNDYNNREDCVEWKILSNGNNGWNDNNCYLAQNFICSIPRGTQLTTTPPPVTGTHNSVCGNSSWVYMGGFCYFLSPENGPTAKLSWYDARRTCQSMRGDLASVHSVDENGFLTSSMSRLSSWTFWLGLNDLNNDVFSWSDGTAVNYISWGAHEPNDDMGGESCVESTSLGDWNDRNCQDVNSYICKRLPGHSTMPPVTLPPVTGGCPHRFTSLPFLENCYVVLGKDTKAMKNFTDAITACQGTVPSSKLASIHNVFEQTYVMTLIAKLPHFAWIGLNDRKQRNYFEWVDNSELRYTHWGPGQPDENLHSNNPGDRRDCVAMNPTPRLAGNWNDMACQNLNHFVCQVQRVPNLPTLNPFNTGCPSGFVNHLTNCYKFFPTPATWQTASNICNNNNAKLATLSDRFQANVVGYLRMPDRQHAKNVTDIWIGFHQQPNTRRFTWVNGLRVSYSAWARNEPDNTGACVKMDAARRWHDHDCSTTLPFVCQISLVPPPTTTTISGLCPNGKWKEYGEYCYQVVTTRPHSWHDSRYACHVLGADLASVHSSAEMTYVSSLISTSVQQTGANATRGVWLGLSKGLTVGFAWSDGTEMEYDNWAAGQPSDPDSTKHQDCVQVVIRDGTWNNVDCFKYNYYVCKMLQVKGTTATTTTTPAPIVTNPPVNPGSSGQHPYRPPVTPQHGGHVTYTPLPPNHGNGGVSPGNGGVSPGHGGVSPGNGGVSPYQPGGTQRQTKSGSNDNGMSGGTVAGIVLGVLGVVVVGAVALALLVRGKVALPFLSGPQSSSGAGGFDNALFSKDPTKEAVSFGSDKNQSDS